jgi:hypothetical protein
MKIFPLERFGLIAIALLIGCGSPSPGEIEADSGTETDSDSESDTWPEYEATGVDILFVVDNSGSMQEEQEILATALFPLINAMVDPLPEWPLSPIDSLRVVVVSSDMGIQWGGNPYNIGDGWPGDTPQGCGSVGDNGEFQTYSSGKTIDIQNDVIPCAADGTQCPTGWTCSATEVDDVGSCQAPSGDGTNQTCPGMAAIWAETPIGPADDPIPNDEIAFQVACLSSLGTSGCGWEQQLQASAVALAKPSQADFLRDDSLLVVFIVSRDVECSIESNELFMVPEIQNLADGETMLACGMYPEYLYDPEHFFSTYLELKGGNPNGVLFAAIVGVPVDDACQGTGDEIGECLDHPDMQLVPMLHNDHWCFELACERFESDMPVVTARPGTAFVELAQMFGSRGYVYSLCNEDLIPAMNDIAQMIANELND